MRSAVLLSTALLCGACSNEPATGIAPKPKAPAPLLTVDAGVRPVGADAGVLPPAPVTAQAEPAKPPPLRIELHANGSILFIANDRWGHAMNATYESVKYLRRAAPTLKRSLTDDQARLLEAELVKLESGSAPSVHP